MRKQKRNGKIELMRFLFAVSVVLFHAQRHYMDFDGSSFHFAFFARGYIGVEFFFLLSGFLMAKKIYQLNNVKPEVPCVRTEYDLGLETVMFVWHKIKAILPWHFGSFFILFVSEIILNRYTLRETFMRLLELIPNLFFFNKMGFDFGNLNRVEWYISCMIFASMLLYPLCRKYYSMFVHVLAPAGGIFLLGYLTENFGTFTSTTRWNGIVFICMIRAIAEIALGAVSFEISRVIIEKNIGGGKKRSHYTDLSGAVRDNLYYRVYYVFD